MNSERVSRIPWNQGTFPGQAGVSVSCPAQGRHAYPGAGADFLLTPSPAQQDSHLKVTGRTSVESKSFSSKISYFFSTSPFCLICSFSETFPLNPPCFCYSLSMLYSKLTWSKPPLLLSVTFGIPLLSPLFGSSYWIKAPWFQ